MKTLKALALLTVPVVGAFLCLLLFQTSAAVKSAADDERALAQSAANAVNDLDAAISNVSVTTQAATRTLASANAVLITVNRSCGGGHPCGTLADVAKTLNTVRGTFGEIEIAAHHEDANLTALDAQELQLFADTHATLTGASDLLASSDITGALSSIRSSSASIADASEQADAVLVDVRKEADKFTQPATETPGFWRRLAHAFMPRLF